MADEFLSERLVLAARALGSLNNSFAGSDVKLEAVEGSLGEVDAILEECMASCSAGDGGADDGEARMEWEALSEALLDFVARVDGLQQARGIASVAALVRLGTFLESGDAASVEGDVSAAGVARLLNRVAAHCHINVQLRMTDLQRAAERSEHGELLEMDDEELIAAQAAAACLETLLEGATSILPADGVEEGADGRGGAAGSARPLASIGPFLEGCVACLDSALAAGSIAKAFQGAGARAETVN
ncbi:hypothetical protein T484DRAFT_1919522 [Baffinella frigidus]|nr:hypothetical protein T484DRAFT_1919522 [Cryptophyta sp. CCMP2293]